MNLADLSSLMQRTIAKGITFMVSKSGVPNYYNLYFAKFTEKGNCSVHLSYHEKEGKIYQYADENHPVIAFGDVDSVLDYVRKEIGGTDEHRDFDVSEDTSRPYCGCEELDYDIVFDVVDCPMCGKRLYYKDILERQFTQ